MLKNDLLRDIIKYFPTKKYLIIRPQAEADDDYWFIGVPSMVAVSFSGMSANAITHMGYFIPIERVCAFMDRNFYGFVHNPLLDPVKCGEDRERVRKIAAAQKELLDLEA